MRARRILAFTGPIRDQGDQGWGFKCFTDRKRNFRGARVGSAADVRGGGVVNCYHRSSQGAGSTLLIKRGGWGLRKHELLVKTARVSLRV